MNKKLFTKFKRIDLSPAPYRGSSYEYLNNSARKYCANIRALMEEWYSKYPDPDQDLRQRLIGKDEVGFNAAFHELVCFTILKSLKTKISLHPKVEGTSKCPDFLVEGKTNYIIEAISASDRSSNYSRELRSIDQLVDYLNENITSDLFFVNFVTERVTSGSEYYRDIANNLRIFIATGDISEAGYTYDNNRWTIKFNLSAKKKKINTRLIGSFTKGGMYEVFTTKYLKNSLIKKAIKYGDLKLPYFIALNNNCFEFDDSDIIDALFGDVTFTGFTDSYGKTKLINHRKKNGLFTGASIHPNTKIDLGKNVNGVVLLNRLDPFRIEECKLSLFLNPFANKEITTELEKFTTYTFKNGIKKVDGITLKSLLNIPDLDIKKNSKSSKKYTGNLQPH